ncbi:MAG: hypothetical protein OHK0021_19010 [Bryobacter sp.]
MLNSRPDQDAPLPLGNALKTGQIGLAFLVALYSATLAYTGWLAADPTQRARLEKAMWLSEKLGLDRRALAMSLAELVPERERDYLEIAVAEGRAKPAALQRLALLEEFAGKRTEAEAYLDRAVASAKQYPVFLAAVAQAQRFGQEDKMLRRAREALLYCPRDADDLFLLLRPSRRAEEALRGARADQRIDFLRFLIGQKDYLRALEYQGELTGFNDPRPSQRLVDLRRELAERLILAREWRAAERLYPAGPWGIRNADFRDEPTSLGFDWRLGQGEGLKVNWRPGLLTIDTEPRDAPKEVLSQYVRMPQGERGDLEILADGDRGRFRWKREELEASWVRLALEVSAGGAAKIELREVRWGIGSE